MSFANMSFTNAGRAMFLQPVAGRKVTFTKIQMGDGKLGTQSIAELTKMIHPITDVGIGQYTVDNKFATLKGSFTNQNIGEGFFWREVGIYAKVEDGQEVLVAYQNAYDLADYIPKSGEIIEKTIAISIFVSDVEKIDAVINESLIYVSVIEFLAHVNDGNLHLPKNGEAGQVVVKTENGAQWGYIKKVDDFDNLLCWENCERSTKRSGNQSVEKIIRQSDGVILAERITIKNAKNNHTEKVMFYGDDGALQVTYTIQTSKNEATSTWSEKIMKEVN